MDIKVHQMGYIVDSFLFFGLPFGLGCYFLTGSLLAAIFFGLAAAGGVFVMVLPLYKLIFTLIKLGKQPPEQPSEGKSPPSSG